ncbi:MAG: hypothetical protein K2P99_03965, partial [Burkholderiales bacterium]|nr:hypothetical protein [Burkholderiales bacterium]
LQNEIHFIVFTTVIILLYVISCCMLLKKYPSFWLFFAIISNASLLAVERGNSDLLIFAVVVFAGLSSFMLLRSILIIIASILKVYPIITVFSLWSRKLYFTFTGMLISLFFITQWQDLAQVRQSTPSPSGFLSYGSYNLSQSTVAIKLHITPLLLDAVLVVLSLIIYYKTRIFKKIENNDSVQKSHIIFLIGGSIYIFTFMLSSNFNYRLIFLMLCIPYICLNLKPVLKYIILILILIISNFWLISLISIRVSSYLSGMASIIIFISIFTLLYDALIRLKSFDLLNN